MKIIQKKSLGQNFLRDKSILQKIISAGELTPQDNILEIGPGEGVLTKRLLSGGAKVVAIEKDKRLQAKNSPLLKLKQKYPDKLNLYFADVLTINLPEILQKENFTDYKIIANIPYYITGKIIRLIFQQKNLPSLVVLLLQKEVAERICASRGKESILSLSVKYFAQPEIVAHVPRQAFFPEPKVDSAILKLKPKEKIDRSQEKNFFRLLKVAFSSPRKTLRNNLKNVFNLPEKRWEEIFSELQLNERVRAEKLSLDDWFKLLKLLDNQFSSLHN